MVSILEKSGFYFGEKNKTSTNQLSVSAIFESISLMEIVFFEINFNGKSKY